MLDPPVEGGGSGGSAAGCWVVVVLTSSSQLSSFSARNCFGWSCQITVVGVGIGDPSSWLEEDWLGLGIARPRVPVTLLQVAKMTICRRYEDEEWVERDTWRMKDWIGLQRSNSWVLSLYLCCSV